MANDNDLITINDLADMLRLSRRTIDRRRASGTLGLAEYDLSTIPGFTMPRFKRADVQAYLHTRQVA